MNTKIESENLPNFSKNGSLNMSRRSSKWRFIITQKEIKLLKNSNKNNNRQLEVMKVPLKSSMMNLKRKFVI